MSNSLAITRIQDQLIAIRKNTELVCPLPESLDPLLIFVAAGMPMRDVCRTS